MRNRSWSGVGRRKSPRKEASGETDVPSTASQPREDEGRWAGLMDPSRLLPREGSSPRDTVLHHPPCSWDPDSVISDMLVTLPEGPQGPPWLAAHHPAHHPFWPKSSPAGGRILPLRPLPALAAVPGALHIPHHGWHQVCHPPSAHPAQLQHPFTHRRGPSSLWSPPSKITFRGNTWQPLFC